MEQLTEIYKDIGICLICEVTKISEVKSYEKGSQKLL